MSLVVHEDVRRKACLRRVAAGGGPVGDAGCHVTVLLELGDVPRHSAP